MTLCKYGCEIGEHYEISIFSNIIFDITTLLDNELMKYCFHEHKHCIKFGSINLEIIPHAKTNM